MGILVLDQVLVKLARKLKKSVQELNVAGARLLHHKLLETKLVGLFFKIILGIPGFPFISDEFQLPAALNYLPVENTEMTVYWGLLRSA
jgi:hypothetical protein